MTEKDDDMRGKEVNALRDYPADKQWPSWLRGETIALFAIGFLGVLFVLRGIYVAHSFHNFMGMLNAADRYEQEQKTFSRFLQALDLAETGQRRYLLTGDLAGLESYNRGIARMTALKAEISRIGSETPRLASPMKDLLALAGQEESRLERSIILFRTLGRDGVIKELGKGIDDDSMDRMRDTIRTVSRVEKDRIENARNDLRLRFTVIRRGFLLFGGFVFLVIGGVSFLIFRSALERDRLLSQLAREATRDFLTGLPNRNFLMKTLSYDLAWIERSGKKLALFYIDLDGFKEVNDQFGHAMGDRVLVEVAARFSGIIRGEDLLCRLGGDEFVVVLREVSDITDASGLAHRLIGALAHPVHPGLADIPVSASIGIAVAPENGATPDSLLRAGDQSMYRAKLSGKGFAFFSEEDPQVGMDGSSLSAF